ncbi:MAG: hypothetical protein J7507_14130 [Pseudoxanthomonas sp.]|nr:hypothetical protein [Pseudoxanthomonas sp.]
MTRAAEIIQALLERAPPRPPLERNTGMPYGWALWLRALPALPARPHARQDDVVDLFIANPPAPAARARELATWPALLSLLQQGWLPPPRDESGMRWTSRVGSGLLHVLFIVFLAWVAYLQSLSPPPPPEEGGGGERIQVGFVGAGDPGTPQATAGEAATASAPGQAAQPAEAVPEAASAPPTTATAVVPPSMPQVDTAVPTPTVQAPALPEVAVREVPEPQPPAPAAEQPVQVTEVERPTIDYVLPPTTAPEPAVRAPAQQVQEREVTVVQAPVIQAPRPRAIDIPVRQPQEAELRQREVDEPLQRVDIRPVTVQGPRVEAPPPRAPESSVRQREVAMPSPPAATPAPAPAPAAAPAPVPSVAQAAGAASAAASGAEAARPSTGQAPGATPGAAAAPAASSGWQSPRAGDDWGQARSGEVRPGGAPGLFDSQGRVRLPGAGEGPGQGPAKGPGQGEGLADRGAPGGDKDSWTRDRIDQSGTWLKRAPYDYEPTSFDRYWVPNESLLADWVRKGIKSVAIPIPGTNKKINCVVSLLQLGGGCGITDPNLNEQPADGRPPPDVPFKPELQEDNGSVGPQG